MSRGIVSIYWGGEDKLPIDRLRASVKKHHPELPHEIIKLGGKAGDASNLYKKSRMLDLTPFDETLFLDIDTVVMSRLDFGFEQSKKHGMAICICEAPWARRYQNLFDGDELEYNTGVLFFTKAARKVFDLWSRLANEADSSLQIVHQDGKLTVMSNNDQGSFALAMAQTNFNPFVLPLNWNFRPQWHRSFFGPIKIWHDYKNPDESIYGLNQYYSSEGHIIQYHALGGRPACSRDG